MIFKSHYGFLKTTWHKGGMKMKTYRVEGKILSSNRLNNSVNGNPCWHFFITD